MCLGCVLTLARCWWEGTVINSEHIIVLLFSVVVRALLTSPTTFSYRHCLIPQRPHQKVLEYKGKYTFYFIVAKV